MGSSGRHIAGVVCLKEFWATESKIRAVISREIEVVHKQEIWGAVSKLRQ